MLPMTAEGTRTRPYRSVRHGFLAAALVTAVASGPLALLLSSGFTTPGPAAATTGGSSVFVGNRTSDRIVSWPTTANGNAKPSSSLKSKTRYFQFSAFDAQGNLWESFPTADLIMEFTAAQIAAGGTQTPSVSLHVPSPTGLVFDGSGNLWVAEFTRLAEYTPSKLAVSGSPTPSVTIMSDAKTPESLDGASSVVFDAAGDLWVTNFLNNTVVEFTHTQLSASGAPTPKVTISESATHALTYPLGMAFDSSGNLWVGSFTLPTVSKFTPAQLATSGDPAPATRLAWKSSFQIGFDSAGDLWVTSPDTTAVGEFTPAQLAAGGTPTPHSTISGLTTGLTRPRALSLSTPPTVTSLTPSTGSPKTTVTVHGTGFTSASTVKFGSRTATTVKVLSPFTLTAVAPYGSGQVTVTVTTVFGTSATSAASQFTYPIAGYDLVGSDGGVFVFPTGQASGFYGSLPALHVVPVKPIVGLVPTVTDKGYFLVGADGGVFSFGTAPFLGSLPGKGVTPTQPITGIVAADTDKGYFLVGRDGGVFAFGTVPFLGSLPGKGISVNNIIGIASTPTGGGYWLVSATGTVYNFGKAQHLGTAKGTSSPVSAIAGTPTGGGYWITAQNGAVYPFGNAKSFGTLPALHVTPTLPVIGIVHTADTLGYWLIGSDGGVFAFGDAGFVGSLPGLTISVGNIVGAVPN